MCDSSDIGKLYNKYARSEDTTLKYQIGHARAWPLIGYILSCLVSPCRRQPPPLTPRWEPMLPWFHSRRQQEAGITFPSPFRHPKSTRHNVMQELLVLPRQGPGVTSVTQKLAPPLNCLTCGGGNSDGRGIGIAVDSHRSDAADSC